MPEKEQILDTKIYQSNLALKISSLSEELHREKLDFWTSFFFTVFISGLAVWQANIKVSEKPLLGLLFVKFDVKSDILKRATKLIVNNCLQLLIFL